MRFSKAFILVSLFLMGSFAGPFHALARTAICENLTVDIKNGDLQIQDRSALSPVIVSQKPQTSTHFLISLHQRLNTLLEKNQTFTYAAIECLENTELISAESGDFSCHEMRQLLLADLGGLMQIARLELGMAFDSSVSPVHQFDELANRMNYPLLSPQLPRPVSWVALNSGEVDAISNLQTEDLNIIRQNDPELKDRRRIAEHLLTLREIHRARYLDLIQNYPILQYLDGTVLSSSKVLSALRATLENNRQRLSWSQRTISALRRQTQPQSLEILAFQDLTREVLLLHPEYCSAYGELVKKEESAKLRNTLIAGGMLIAMIVAPPTIGFFAGSALLSYVAIDAYQARDQALRDSAVGVSGSWSILPMKDVIAKDNELKAQVMIGSLFIFSGASSGLRPLGRLSQSSPESILRVMLSPLRLNSRVQ